MAEKCASCGRADLMQALVDNYQCLACGELTNMATHQVVPSNIPNVTTSPSGHPVTELSHGVTQAEANEFKAPVHVEEEAVEEESLVEEAPIDFSNLTPEQLADIQAIVNSEEVESGSEETADQDQSSE